jgi:hypothetical protein
MLIAPADTTAHDQWHLHGDVSNGRKRLVNSPGRDTAIVSTELVILGVLVVWRWDTLYTYGARPLESSEDSIFCLEKGVLTACFWGDLG